MYANEKHLSARDLGASLFSSVIRLKNMAATKGGYYYLPGMHRVATILSNGWTPREVHFSMDAVEITTRQLEVFEKSSIIYLNCVDLAVDIRESSEMLPFIEYKMLLGHVNFPDELKNRRLVLFPNTQQTVTQFENVRSPAVIEVTASSIVKLDGEKAVALIYQWNMLDNLSVTATSMQPVEIYDVENKLDLLPWLDVTTAVCNCSRFPAVGSVVVNVDSDAYGFVDARLGGPDDSEELELEEEDESEQESDKDDDEVGEIEHFEEQCYAEKIKLKGCSFHEQFQLALKKCQRLIAMHEDIELKLSFESVNMRDDNAIVAQAKLDDIWQSLGYVPAPKVPKVTVAMQKHHIQSVRLVRVYRTYIHDIGVHRYFGDTIVVKKGRWERDTKTYSYNDLPTGKFD